MDNRIIIRLFLLLFIIESLLSCNNDVSDNIVYEDIPQFDSFCFLKKDNPQLNSDIQINVANDSLVEMFIPHIKTDSLISSFSGRYERVEVGGVSQISGVTANNFNNEIVYSLYGKNGKERRIRFLIRGYNGIPRVIIETSNREPISSREDYVIGSIKIENSPEHPLIMSDCKIRGRGNASWNHPKKSYKVKANKKISPFGFPSNKDWVLLGNYTDKSLLRTVYVSELSKAMNIKYTINYQMVELVLNGEYLGVYCFTDQVEKAKTRIDIDKDGYFIEDDTYYKREPLFFKSDLCGYNFTFKYPKADAGDIIEGDENYVFIKDYINKMELALLNIEKSDDYKKYVDIESFAKYFVVGETTGNINPNRFYVLHDKNSKLEAYPFWDAEWSFGLGRLIDNNWKKYPYPPMPVNEPFYENYRYFKYLVKSQDFRSEVIKVWTLYKESVPGVLAQLKSIRESLIYAQEDNFRKWDVLGVYLDESLVAFDTWEEEIEYIDNWYKGRMSWFEDYLTDWN